MVLQRIEFELVAGVSVNYDSNTCERLAVNVLKRGPKISDPTKRVIHNSICLILMEH